MDFDVAGDLVFSFFGQLDVFAQQPLFEGSHAVIVLVPCSPSVSVIKGDVLGLWKGVA